MATIWLDKAPRLVVDEHGVLVNLDIDGQPTSYRLPRSIYRAYLERGLRAMDDADRAQQGRVAHLRRSCPLPENMRCG